MTAPDQLRDYFAGIALRELLTEPAARKGDVAPAAIAESAYLIADAMIIECERGRGIRAQQRPVTEVPLSPPLRGER